MPGVAALPIMSAIDDEILFGWDPTPGIVSVWADHDGQAVVWRRVSSAIVCERARFRPWLLATSLDDLAHLRGAQDGTRYRELEGDEGSYRYLITAPDGRALAIGRGTPVYLPRRPAWRSRPSDPRQCSPLPTVHAPKPFSLTSPHYSTLRSYGITR